MNLLHQETLIEMASSVEGYKQQLQVQQEHYESRQAELNNRVEQLQEQAKLEGQELEKSLKSEVNMIVNCLNVLLYLVR